MKGLKCYLAYTPRLYKIIVMVLLPALVLALECLNIITDKVALFVLLSSGVVFYECMADCWHLGGLHSKEYVGLRLIQSSERGLAFSKKVVLWDCLRKYAYMAIFAVADLLILFLSSGAEAVAKHTQVVWYIYWASTGVLMLFTLISRFVCNITGVVFFSYLAYVVVAVGYAPILAGNGYGAVWMLAMWGAPIVSMGFASLLVLVGCKKMEGSYYDS